MPRKIKHIPENSITIIFKFNTNGKKIEVLNNAEFQKAKAKLESIIVQKGGDSTFFTNP